MRLNVMMTNTDQRSGNITNIGVLDAFTDFILIGKLSIAFTTNTLKSMVVVFADEKSATEKYAVAAVFTANW